MNDGLNLPGWFVKLAGGILAAAVPWAMWMSMGMNAINIKIEAMSDHHALLSSQAERITRLEERLKIMEIQARAKP